LKNSNKYDILQPDVFDLLSAIWVIACNDENPIITYKGITYRLKLDGSFNVRELIQSRGDLFRLGVPEERLNDWKARMLQGKNLPSWISSIEDKDERKKTIDDLTYSDVFRCQFRIEDKAPKTTLAVIDWGLQHIDRLRKATHEARDRSVKSWQMWLVFGIGLLNIVATVVSAILKK
jgi:hypothetical protein